MLSSPQKNINPSASPGMVLMFFRMLPSHPVQTHIPSRLLSLVIYLLRECCVILFFARERPLWQCREVLLVYQTKWRIDHVLTNHCVTVLHGQGIFMFLNWVQNGNESQIFICMSSVLNVNKLNKFPSTEWFLFQFSNHNLCKKKLYYGLYICILYILVQVSLSHRSAHFKKKLCENVLTTFHQWLTYWVVFCHFLCLALRK